MGTTFARFWSRLVEFPIKNKPMCFHLQRNFASTGEEISEDTQVRTDAYDELQNAFVRKLAEIEDFPYWDQLVINNLNNIFILLASENNGMMDLQRFCWFLDSIGDKSSDSLREEKFKKADSNDDGFVNFDEFLPLVYNYYSDNLDGSRGVAKICYEMSEQIRFVNSLSVGEQLQYGLF